MVQKKSNKKKHSLRIIGGAWRSRRIHFVNTPEIRPTPDRVRETLFNWLSASIVGASCLDLFAGSGALGFEAASRGANRVILVELNTTTVAMLVKQKQSLDAQQVHIVQQDALQFLQQTKQQFDIVFLDPPFNTNLLEQTLSILISRKFVKPSSLIYVEASKQLVQPQDLSAFTRIREKVAGQVRYALYAMQNQSSLH